MPFKIFLLVTFLLPITLFAQSDGFFRVNDDDSYNNRASWTNPTGEGGLNNQQFGQPVPGPLGSGLLILTAAGAGYAVLRRKRSRKNITMLLAFALILGMTNCKKKTDAVDNEVTEGVRITLNVNNGSKHSINLGNGVVTYTNGDVIYVGNNKQYCGRLEFNGTNFTGDITPTKEGEYLYFYYTSKTVKGMDWWNVNSSSTTYTLDVSDQTTYRGLTVLSCGRSTVPYTSGTTSYSCWLENKCALVKFDCPEGVNAKVKVTGLVTEATLDFANETITPTETTREITLYSNGLTEKWAILLPQTVTTAPTVSIAGYSSNIAIPPTPWEIHENNFIQEGVTITNVPALFKANDHIVNFSPGNLRATTSDYGANWTWSFASNQYDYIGNNTANNKVNGNGTVSENGTVDLFGWSTSSTYHGINPSTTDSDYSGDFVDWGDLITDPLYTWRTMEKAEWKDLLDQRAASTVNDVPNARYTMAEINTDGTSVFGLIIFPDKTIGATPEGVTWGSINTYTTNDAWSTRTTCTTAGWNALEGKGCVFLPTGGFRNGTVIEMNDYLGGIYGGYWSKTISGDNINYMFFGKEKTNSQSEDYRHRGHSVRLVREVE